ncbi:GGDEF domain-containing protein [Mesorhizobium loti]|nr:GGDEF domain-containing protein [Mesorhizobium loti]PLP58348.1 GGDEF domain-containing protein [Mesorhizobium loti]
MANEDPKTRTLTDWLPIAKLVLIGTAVCIGVSAIFNYLLLFGSFTSFQRTVITTFAVPIVIGAPVFTLLSLKIEELRRLKKDLTHSASHDRTTNFYHADVFSSLVDRRVRAPMGQTRPQGALLMVDAGQLRATAEQYGFEWANEALRLIATTIRSSVRKEDFVGRLGETEFGVFLHHASEQDALEVGQRIRNEVAKVYFAPQGNAIELAVQVGGISFENATTVTELLRVADKQLEAAKRQSGGLEIKRLIADS